MSKTKVGVIGLGVMGSRMVGIMSRDGRFEFTGAWDPAESARKATARDFPNIPILDSPEAVIESGDAELIYVGSPPVSHKAYALAAAAAGKALYCEKPLGVDLADSGEMVAGLEAAGTRNAINFLQSTSHAVALTTNRIADGSLGDIVGGDIIMHFSKWPRDWQANADWLRFRAEGGYTREVLSHFVFLATRLIGEPRVIAGHTRYPADPALCETHITALLDCAGIPVQVFGSSGGTGPDRVEFTIWGTKRSYRLHDWFWLQSTDGGAWETELAEIEDLRTANYPRLMDNVLAMKDGKPSLLPTARQALEVQATVEAMLRG